MAGTRTILYLGPPDSGKTHRLRMDCASADAADGPSIVLDLDCDGGFLAQPGLVALGSIPDGREPESMLDRFVGTLAPWDDSTTNLGAAVALAAKVRRTASAVLHVDTPGFVDSPPARQWLGALIDALAPDRIVWCRTSTACPGEALIRSVDSQVGVEVVSNPSSVRKSRIVRETRRTARLSRLFEGSAPGSIPIDGAVFLGTRLGTGRALPPGRCQWLSDIVERSVDRAEILTDHTLLAWIGDGSGAAPLDPPGWVAETLGARRVRFVRVASLHGRVGAWISAHGLPPEPFRIRGIDGRTQSLLIASPSPPCSPIDGTVRLGRFRLDPHGAASRIPLSELA